MANEIRMRDDGSRSTPDIARDDAGLAGKKRKRMEGEGPSLSRLPPVETDGENLFHLRMTMLATLYASLGIVCIGIVASGTMALINVLSIADDRITLAFVGIAVVGLMRMALTRAFRAARTGIRSLAEIDFWETCYLVGAVSTLSGFGLIAAISVVRHPDDIMSFVAVVTCLASSLSVATRNYASGRVVNSAVLACCVPLAVASLWNAVVVGEVIYWGIAATPVFVTVMSIYLGNYLRSQHVQTVRMAQSAAINERQAEMNADRFELALSAMPAGLVLVDDGGNLSVVNSLAAEMLGIDRASGGSFEDAVARAFGPVERAAILECVDLVSDGAVPEATGSKLVLPTVDGRWFQCEANATGRVKGDGYRASRERAVVVFQDATERVRADQALVRAACYDKLTGIPNRQHWETLVRGAVAELRPDESVALCILDIDRFKLINDTLGHHVGDEVIAGVAERLAASSGDRLICGRVGGDEFVVLVPSVGSRSEVCEIFDRVFAEISRPYMIAGNIVDVRCSGGVIVRSRVEFSLQENLNRADTALYKVKKNPERCWMLFDDEMEEEYRSASRIKHDLKAAIADGALEVRYQPIFDPSGETMVSTEALCRWEHSEAGYISPTQFIAMAEELGVIGKLTQYVLRTACRDCRSWGADVPVSVNLSAMDLARDGVVEMIRAALAEFDLPAGRLCIEVTETVFVKDFAKTASTLRTLRSMGVKTSLDDFGTGYSSLSYLSQLPLNRVKIDRAFVLGIVEDAVVQRLFKGVVSLAKELEFEVIVEGVEDEAQLDYIRRVPGVDMIQGYVFSEPLTAAEMAGGHHVRVAPVRGARLRLVEKG